MFQSRNLGENMLDPYKMIVVNIIASIVLFGALILFKHFFPKKKINFLYLLISISILPVISILRKGVYESGDFTDHIKGTVQFYTSLSQGNIIPQLTSANCNGYTCPDFIFHYLSPHYIMSFFHSIGFSFIASEKIFLLSAFILSGIAMYYWLKEEFGERAAFVGSIFYLFSPYYLVDMHFRNDVGELMCFLILPLCFFFTKKLVELGRNKYFLALTFLVSLLILSHQAISFFSIFFIFSYGVLCWTQKNKRNVHELIHYFFSIFMGIFLTAFYWLPIIIEKKYIGWGNSEHVDLLSLSQLLYSPWRLGFLFQGHKGELSFLIGYIQIFIIFISVYFLIKNKINKKYKIKLKIFLVAFLLITFFMLNFSEPLWKHFPLLNLFGWSYRLLLFDSIIISYIAALVSINIRSKKIIIICFVVIFSTILNWGNRRTLPNINDGNVINELNIENSGRNIITLPIWVKGDYYYKNGRAKTHIDQLGIGANIKELPRTVNHHEYLIEVSRQTLFRENTFYFPGWNLYVNNKPHSFIYNFPIHSGTMYFLLPKGIYDVEFKFEDTKNITLGKIISAASFMLMTLVLCFRGIVTRTTKMRKKT